MKLNRRTLRMFIKNTLQENLESDIFHSLKSNYGIKTTGLKWDSGTLFAPDKKTAEKIAKVISADSKFNLKGEVKHFKERDSFSSSNNPTGWAIEFSKGGVREAISKKSLNEDWDKHSNSLYSSAAPTLMRTYGNIKNALLPDLWKNTNPPKVSDIKWKTIKDGEGDVLSWEAKYRGITFTIWND